MIKKILRYVQQRREIKLRKWCVSQAAKTDCNGYDLPYIAYDVYKWVIKGK
ncbi:hypothetical protein IX296_000986 [Bacteroides pyogenes]|nr:hypothetical protein [Bacteroides pyogenes]MBR8753913.1 hypothetical protein [Bacteroides pyogenes]MBR8808707.1 hypothetical protein [Bacteroides pyogenes]